MPDLIITEDVTGVNAGSFPDAFVFSCLALFLLGVAPGESFLFLDVD